MMQPITVVHIGPHADDLGHPRGLSTKCLRPCCLHAGFSIILLIFWKLKVLVDSALWCLGKMSSKANEEMHNFAGYTMRFWPGFGTLNYEFIYIHERPEFEVH